MDYMSLEISTSFSRIPFVRFTDWFPSILTDESRNEKKHIFREYANSKDPHRPEKL